MNFYVVATPIGNLEDISLRALRILKEVDFVLSEDTRVTRKLLSHYDIKKELISFHHHSGQEKYNKVLTILKQGNSLALVSDAGTPNISDPGAKLVSFLRDNLSNLNIEAIPGPSAITTALSISGISSNKFSFFGFLPHKKGRSKALLEVLNYNHPVILYESKHRFLKLLKELQSMDFNKKIMVFREMTKMHQSFYNESLDDMYKIFEQDNNNLKGEFTIILYE